MRNVNWFEKMAARDMRRGGGRRGGRGGGFGGGDGGGGGEGGDPRGEYARRMMGMHGRGRARRGDIRAAILKLLAEQPRNGYQIMQELEARSGWKPSSGSVYPTLQQLEDEELVTIEAPKLESASRTYKLTARGETYVKENADDLKEAWATHASEGGSMHPRHEIGMLIRQIAPAAMHVVQSGTPTQIAEAKKLLTEVRRGLYRILSEDPDDTK